MFGGAGRAEIVGDAADRDDQRVVAELALGVDLAALVVDHRPGGSGALGGTIVKTSPKDGYTLLAGTAANAVSASLYAKLGYDFLKDFAPISLLASLDIWLVAPASVPARSFREFVSYAKTQPSKLAFSATGGTSGLPYIAAVLVRDRTGMDITFVPYKANDQDVVVELHNRFGAEAFVAQETRTGMPVLWVKRAQLNASSTDHALGIDDQDISAGLIISNGIFWNQGEICSAGSRVFIQEDIYDDAVAALVEKARAVRLGAGLDEGLHRLGGGHIAGDDLYPVRELLDARDLVDDMDRMAMGGIDDDGVHPRLHQRGGAFFSAFAHANGRGNAQLALLILGSVRVLGGFANVFHGDQAAQLKGIVDDQHAL